MTADALSLRAVAQELGVTYDWLQRHWRGLPGFPPPYIGAGRGERPRWWRQAILDFKAGRRFSPAAPAEAPPSARVEIANDLHPQSPTDLTAALLAAAGG